MRYEQILHWKGTLTMGLQPQSPAPVCLELGSLAQVQILRLCPAAPHCRALRMACGTWASTQHPSGVGQLRTSQGPSNQDILGSNSASKSQRHLHQAPAGGALLFCRLWNALNCVLFPTLGRSNLLQKYGRNYNALAAQDWLPDPCGGADKSHHKMCCEQ